MRCSCCNKALNNYESTLKSATTGEYMDTCMDCLDGLDIETVGREDLNWFEAVEGDDEVEDDDET